MAEPSPDTDSLAHVPAAVRTNFDYARQLIEQHNTFITVAHPKMDGDALGSCLGLVHLLRALGKRAVCVSQGAFHQSLRFLPGTDEILYWDGAWIEPWAPQVICTCDVGSYERVEEVLLSFGMTCSILNFDHHLSNDGFGSVSLNDPTASATGEVIYNFATHCGYRLSKEAALCLFVAVYTDTGSFSYSNTTGAVLRVAAHLVEQGVDVSEVSHRLYRAKSLARLKLEALIIERIEVHADGRLATAALSREDVYGLGLTFIDVDNVVNIVKSVDTARVAALFSETDLPGTIKISFRGEGFHDLNAFAARFGGGGHPRASGATVPGTLDDVRERVLAELKPLAAEDTPRDW